MNIRTRICRARLVSKDSNEPWRRVEGHDCAREANRFTARISEQKAWINVNFDLKVEKRTGHRRKDAQGDLVPDLLELDARQGPEVDVASDGLQVGSNGGFLEHWPRRGRR